MDLRAARKKAASFANKTAKEEEAIKKEIFADGIYFNLDEKRYHADPALGSTSLRQLAVSPPEWWWQSEYNEFREEKRSIPMDLGKALHARILESRTALDERFEAYDYELRSQAAKSAYQAIKDSGRIPLKKELYDKVVQSRQFILANPIVREIYKGGLAEVSIFWTHKGTRLKARIDWISANKIADLKTFASREDRGIETEISRQLSDSRLIVAQAAHYLEGFKQAKKLVEAGEIYGDIDKNEGIAQAKFNTFMTALEQAASIDFSFIFFKTTGAPQSWVAKLSHGNTLLESGKNVIKKGIENYQNFSGQYGLDTPWLFEEEPKETEIYMEELPPHAAIFMEKKL